jgi:hypothetical protein
VYQVYWLFGNKNTNNKPWGTIEENGVASSMILQIKHLMKSKLWALLIFGIQGTSCIGGIIAQLVFQMTTRML